MLDFKAHNVHLQTSNWTFFKPNGDSKHVFVLFFNVFFALNQNRVNSNSVAFVNGSLCPGRR